MKQVNLIVKLCLMFFVTAGFFQVGAQQVFKTTPTSVIGFLEYLPPDYNTNSDKYPVVIFLHGLGERGPNTTDLATLEAGITTVTRHGPPKHVKNGTQFPFILISPQLKNNYGDWPPSYVMEVINYCKTYLRIDERRIHLTGLSLGGGGTWWTAQDYPKLFATIAPVCGSRNTVSKACLLAAENLPVWAFHGDIDPTVPLSRSVNMINAINQCTPLPNPLAKLTIYPGVAHNAWDNAYRPDHTVHNPNVYDWIMSYTNTKNGANQIPVANAGSDVTLSGSSVTLSGGASDDESVAGYSWTQISGPSPAVVPNSTSPSMTVSGLVAGTYMFRMKVTDSNGDTDSDYVKVTVQAQAVAPPVANAGADKLVRLPLTSYTIVGSGTSSTGTIVSYQWSQLSGPALGLVNANTSRLKITNLVSGICTFRLTVKDDKGVSATDDVKVTLDYPPVVNAGADKTITLPTNTVTLSATATDPDGTIQSYAWSKYSGPGATLVNRTTASLTANNLLEGTYVFKLAVKDNQGAQTIDYVTVTVLKSSTTTSARTASQELPTVEDPAVIQEEVASYTLNNTELKKVTVVVFNELAQQVYSGAWGDGTYGKVFNQKGLYYYNVFKDGSKVDAGKVYIVE